MFQTIYGVGNVEHQTKLPDRLQKYKFSRKFKGK
jgi:hypothetical protein